MLMQDHRRDPTLLTNLLIRAVDSSLWYILLLAVEIRLHYNTVWFCPQVVSGYKIGYKIRYNISI